MMLGRIGPNRRCRPPGCDVIEGSTVQKAIPPDSTAAGSRRPGISQQEAIGDLHLAADAFANAAEAYKAAVAGTPPAALGDRVRLLLRVARAELLRGRPQEALAEAASARETDRKSTRLNSSHVSESRMPSS